MPFKPMGGTIKQVAPKFAALQNEESSTSLTGTMSRTTSKSQHYRKSAPLKTTPRWSIGRADAKGAPRYVTRKESIQQKQEMLEHNTSDSSDDSDYVEETVGSESEYE